MADPKSGITLNKVGLAALVLLAPGGFILGAALATRYYRRRSAQAGVADEAQSDEAAPAAPRRGRRSRQRKNDPETGAG